MDIFENREEIELYTNLNLWGNVSIDLYFRRKIQNNRQEIGLTGYSLCEDQSTQLNYAQIQSIIDRISQQLLFSGLNSGDVLALQLPNSTETQLLYLACWQQGITVAPLPSLWRQKDVKQALIRISPQAFICPILHDGFNYTELMYQIGLDISSIKQLFSLGGNAIDGCIALDDCFKQDQVHDVNLLKPEDYQIVDANSSCLISFSKDKLGNNVPYYHTHNQLIAATHTFNSLTNPTADNKITSPFPPTSLAICSMTIVSWALSEASLNCYDGLMATEFQNIPIDSAILYLPTAFDEPKLLNALFEQGLDKLVFINKYSASKNRKTSETHNIIDVTTFDEFAFITQTRTMNMPAEICTRHEYNVSNANIQDFIEISEYQTKSGQNALKITCSFLPINIVKTENSYKSNILNNDSNLMDSNISIGNMALDYADVERELLNFHGVEDAAILAIENNLLGLKPVLAIVPKVGAVILLHEIVNFLKNKQVSNYKIPQELYKIPNIPRNFDNQIIRKTSKQQLLKLVGPQNSGGDGLLAVQQELASLLANPN